MQLAPLCWIRVWLFGRSSDVGGLYGDGRGDGGDVDEGTGGGKERRDGA